MMYKENLKDADHQAVLATMAAQGIGENNPTYQATQHIFSNIDRKEPNYFLTHRVTKELNSWIMTREEDKKPNR